MTIQHVLVCQGMGCRSVSQPHVSEQFLVHFERFVHSWGVIDIHLGQADEPEYEDYCPRCMAEHFFGWFLVQFQNGEHFGSAHTIRPNTPMYAKFDKEYTPTRNPDGWDLPYCKMGHGPTGEDERGNKRHIMPAFICEYPKEKVA